MTGTVISISISQAVGASFDASFMLFPEHNLHYVLILLKPELCNTMQH
jgi:hypothetical protein